MALPTAPLGSLPNLNQPSFVPTYEKPKGTLDKALAAFLVGVAQQAGGTAVNNAMSRDYSDNPASGFDKLISGPRENQAMNQQRTGIEASKALEQQREDAASQQQLQGQNAGLLQQDLEQAHREMLAGNNLAAQQLMERLRIAGDTNRDAARSEADLSTGLAIHGADQQGREQLEGVRAGNEMAQLKAKLDAEAASPRSEYEKELTLTARADRQRMEQMMSAKQQGGKKPINKDALRGAREGKMDTSRDYAIGDGAPAQAPTPGSREIPPQMQQFFQNLGVYTAPQPQSAPAPTGGAGANWGGPDPQTIDPNTGEQINTDQSQLLQQQQAEIEQLKAMLAEPKRGGVIGPRSGGPITPMFPNALWNTPKDPTKGTTWAGR